MTTVSVKRALLHVCAPGCIVNVTPGLMDRDGHAVTSVEVICDRYAGEQHWSLVDLNHAHAMNIRVLQETEEEAEARRQAESGKLASDTEEETQSVTPDAQAGAKMTLVELLTLANSGYPDGEMAGYYDAETGEETNEGGDTLALFVVREIRETFDADADREAQLTEARRVVQRGIEDLQATLGALGSEPESTCASRSTWRRLRRFTRRSHPGWWRG